MPKYKVTFTAVFEGFVEANNEDDAAAAVHIPELPELDSVPEGARTIYVVDSCEALKVEKLDDSPYDLRTKAGDRFIVATPFSPSVLMEAREVRVRGDDIWNCYPVEGASPEQWPNQKLKQDTPMVLTDGEVQTKIANTIASGISTT